MHPAFKVVLCGLSVASIIELYGYTRSVTLEIDRVVHDLQSMRFVPSGAAHMHIVNQRLVRSHIMPIPKNVSNTVRRFYASLPVHHGRRTQENNCGSTYGVMIGDLIRCPPYPFDCEFGACTGGECRLGQCLSKISSNDINTYMINSTYFRLGRRIVSCATWWDACIVDWDTGINIYCAP